MFEDDGHFVNIRSETSCLITRRPTVLVTIKEKGESENSMFFVYIYRQPDFDQGLMPDPRIQLDSSKHRR